MRKQNYCHSELDSESVKEEEFFWERNQLEDQSLQIPDQSRNDNQQGY